MPPVSVELANVHPPIFPPVNNTCEPLTSPSCFTLNALELIKRVCVESLISTPVVVKLCSSIVKLAILPPVNNTLDPVISPVALTLNGALPVAVNDEAPLKNRVSPIEDNPV